MLLLDRVFSSLYMHNVLSGFSPNCSTFAVAGSNKTRALTKPPRALNTIHS